MEYFYSVTTTTATAVAKLQMKNNENPAWNFFSEYFFFPFLLQVMILKEKS
jgi:hypothetical protein